MISVKSSTKWYMFKRFWRRLCFLWLTTHGSTQRGYPMVIRYNFHIENFTRYPGTGAVDSDVLESSLYIMKACPVMYTGLRQLRLFTTPIGLLIDPY